MTSRRRLKKEIDYVVSDLIVDCFTIRNVNDEKANEESLQIIQDTLLLRNKLRDEANHPEKKGESAKAKSYYDNIAKTLVDGVEAGYGKLEKLVYPEK